MDNAQQNNPLHGVTLEAMLSQLVNHYGWEQLSEKLPINCFLNDPSLKSSLTFLRRTPWARAKLEEIYLSSQPTATSDDAAATEPRKILRRRLPAAESTPTEAEGANQEQETDQEEQNSAAPSSIRPRISHREKPRSSARGKRGESNRGDGKGSQRQSADGRGKRNDRPRDKDGKPQGPNKGNAPRAQRERRAASDSQQLWRNDADPVEQERMMQQRYAEQLNKGSRSGNGDKERRNSEKGAGEQAKRPRRQSQSRGTEKSAAEGAKPASPWGKPGQNKRPRQRENQE